ncbi:hypothetical protein IH824_05565 [candidate division KSB1 bacterium]|nr:hypothetical protein [candidate division KSB1 bacterium]
MTSARMQTASSSHDAAGGTSSTGWESWGWITRSLAITMSTAWSFTDPAGNTMEGKGEMKRVKEMTSK